MQILPAIDLYDGKAVRLYKGDYAQMTVYSDDPAAAARAFKSDGAQYLHVVDLEGARDGTTANFETIKRIYDETGLTIEVGGGVRSMDVIEKYISAGIKRVILGTAAITKPNFVPEAVRAFGGAVAVSVDIKDGRAAIKGWTETSDTDALYFCRDMEDIGVKTIICTDISKDGALGGTNLELYHTLRGRLTVGIIASGGITRVGELTELAALGIDGAILGKVLYTGGLKLPDAISAAKGASN